MGWVADRRGQMTVESALLLPTVLVVVALLVQPACLVYTRSVMASAELARVALTSRSSDEEERAYALRRLAAVPDLALFHEGGPDAWEVSVSGPSDAGRVSVRITGRARPLPLLGAIASAFGEREGGCVVLSVEATEELRPTWREGSYEDWVGMWG